MEIGLCRSNKSECAKIVLMFCRKSWVKQPEDHGGRLSELHEVPDVHLQRAGVCESRWGRRAAGCCAQSHRAERCHPRTAGL